MAAEEVKERGRDGDDDHDKREVWAARGRAAESPPYPLEDEAAALDSAQGTSLSLPSAVNRRYRSSLLRLLVLSYNAVTEVSLAFFYTQNVGVYGRRLWNYPAIDPTSDDYKVLLPLVILCLVGVVAGGPIALAAYLVTLRSRGQIGLQAEAESEGSDGAQSRAQTQAAGQLFVAMFKPRYWFMPAALVLRRLVLIVLWTSLPMESVFKALSLVNGGLVVLQTALWPYRRKQDNWLELLMLTALWLQTQLLDVSPSELDRPAGISAGLWLLVLLPCLVAGLLASTSMLRLWCRGPKTLLSGRWVGTRPAFSRRQPVRQSSAKELLELR
jgi:phosphatidylglycerophosphate synthase